MLTLGQQVMDLANANVRENADRLDLAGAAMEMRVATRTQTQHT